MKKQKIATHTKVAAAAALAAFQLSVAYAQANNDTLKLDEVVVTGSATGGSKMKQSLSISTLDSEQLTNTVASSSADLLRSDRSRRSNFCRRFALCPISRRWLARPPNWRFQLCDPRHVPALLFGHRRS
jgi:hypothetical protein